MGLKGKSEEERNQIKIKELENSKNKEERKQGRKQGRNPVEEVEAQGAPVFSAAGGADLPCYLP